VIDGRIEAATSAVGSTLYCRPIRSRTVRVSSSTSVLDSALQPATEIGAPKVTKARERYPTA